MENLRLRRWGGLVLVGTLLLCAVLRLWPLQFDYYHPDEVIAVEVARRVVDTGSLDTNWKNAALPVDFKLPQYNFSGYMLSAAAVDWIEKTFAGAGRDTLAALRLWSALLSVLATALAFFAGRALFGTAAGLIAALLVTASPLLVQDAFYARPEPFVTALTLLVILGVPARALLARIFLTALVVGLLIATKISMVSLLPLLFLPAAALQTDGRFWPAFVAYVKQALREAPRRAAAAIPGVLVGFSLGAPFALVNFEDYLTGVNFLVRQYSMAQWPFGLGEASTPERLGYATAYFSATAGAPVLILAVLGGAWAAVDRNFRALALFICTAVVAIRFATYPTFFERNFSHLMPIVLMFAAFGLVRLIPKQPQRPWITPVMLTALLVLAAAPAAKTTYLLLAEEINGEARAELRRLRLQMAATHGEEPTSLSADETYGMLGARNFHHCGAWLLEVVHFHSARSDAALPKVAAATGFTEVGRYVSKFAYVPTSSVHTYLTPTIVYLYRPADQAKCEASGDAIDPRRAQEPLAIIDAAMDPTWTARGAYLSAYASPPDLFYGSWTGADANKGTLRMTVRVEGHREMIIPYTTGPSPWGQSVRVTDRADGREIWKSDPLPASGAWTYLRVPLTGAPKEVVVEATDNGADWGQWHAIASPRAVSK